MKKFLAAALFFLAPSFSFCLAVEPALMCGAQFSAPIEDYGILISDGYNVYSLSGYRDREAAAGYKVGWSESTISPLLGGGLFLDFSNDFLCSIRCAYVPGFSYSAEFDDTANHITFTQKASVGLFTAAPGITLQYTVNDSLAFYMRAEFPGVAVQTVSFSYRETLADGEIINDSSDTSSQYGYYYSAGVGVKYRFNGMVYLAADLGYSSAAQGVNLVLNAAFDPGGIAAQKPAMKTAH